MISLTLYKLIHLSGVLMVFLSVGGVITHFINEGSKTHNWKKPLAITHGIGLLLSLVGGFGLLARLGIGSGGFPVWVWLKLAIWIIFALMTALIIRKTNWAKPLWLATILLGIFAAYLAGSKPF